MVPRCNGRERLDHTRDEGTRVALDQRGARWRGPVSSLTQVNRRVWIRAHDRLIDSLIHVAFAAATVDRKYSSRGGGMGIDMQIVYLGFAGSAQIESEAAAQLVRLERFGRCISGCHLALEAIRRHAGYDVPGARLTCPITFRTNACSTRASTSCCAPGNSFPSSIGKAPMQMKRCERLSTPLSGFWGAVSLALDLRCQFPEA